MPADEGQRAGVVAPSSVLSEQQRDEILRALLSEHPIAMIAAIQDNGLFCPMPVSVPVSRQSTMSGRSALDVVLPADQPAVISAWDTVKERGASQVSVDLLGYPPVAASLRFVDMRHRHGVLLGVCIVTGAAAGGVGDAEQARVARPRYTRWVMTDTATITAVDDAASVLLGYAPEDLLGRRSSELIHPDEQNVAIDMWMDMLARPGVPRRSRSRHRHADGRWIWMETVAENLLSDPEQGCVIVEKFDISEEMAAQEALRAREQLLHRLAEALPLGVVQIDLAGDVVYANDRLAEVLGVSSGTLSERLAGVLESDRAKLTAAVAAVLNGEDEDLELRLRRGADEELRRVHLAARPLTDDQGSVIGAIASVSDVTDSVRLREQLHERATFDPLTRCFNRAAILAELDRLAVVQIPAQADPVEDATDHVRGDGGPSGIAVVFIDIDRFKEVNDGLGHAAGDELLKVAVRRLRDVLRDDDRLGRIGGDEFLVLCPQVTDRLAASIGDRLARALSGCVALSGVTVPLQASVGVAWSAAPLHDAARLIHEADEAMYASKRRATGSAVVYGEGAERPS